MPNDAPSVVMISPDTERFARIAEALRQRNLRLCRVMPPSDGSAATIPAADALIAGFIDLDATAGDAVANLAAAGLGPVIVVSVAMSQDAELDMLRHGAQEVVDVAEDAAACDRLRVAVLRAIERHAFHRADEAAKHQRRAAEAKAMMDMFPVAVVMADCEGRIRMANRRAQALIAEADALFADPKGHIRLTDKVQNGALYETMRRAQEDADIDCALTAPRKSGMSPLSVLVIPVGRGEEARGKGVTLFIAAPETPLEIPVATLEGLYGFTLAEARLVIALVAGQKLDEIAEASGTSLHTVRNQLKSVFRKTDTNRQAELMKLILTGPAVFRAHADARVAAD